MVGWVNMSVDGVMKNFQQQQTADDHTRRDDGENKDEVIH